MHSCLGSHTNAGELSRTLETHMAASEAMFKTLWNATPGDCIHEWLWGEEKLVSGRHSQRPSLYS